jgi:uncharacterized protein YceH (UPF0502 family)
VSGQTAGVELSAEAARALACLIEKEALLPDSYPLTLNALRLGCNQSSNRFPVVEYNDRTVELALQTLKSLGLVRFVHPSHGARTARYRHVAGEHWQLEPNELAVLATLVLRGPQTLGELRSRVERQLDARGPTVEAALDTLAAHDPGPLVVQLDRRPGEREQRWAHLLSGEVDEASFAPAEVDGRAPASRTATSGGDGRVAALEAEVATLRQRLDQLESLLGIDPVEPARHEPT